MPMQPYLQRLLGAGFLTVLVLVLGAWWLPKQPNSSMGSDWFWSNKVRPGCQFEVVVVGDSRIYRGFSPVDFVATYDTTATVFNFGFSSAGLDTSFLQAAALLVDSTAKQPVIILGITTSSLADENAANQHFWQEYNRSAASIWQRQHLNASLTAFDPTSPYTLRNHWLGTRQGYYQRYYDNGWIASDKQPHNPWESYDHVRQTYPQVEFSLGFRQRLVQQIAQWQAQGIQVVAFRPPAFPELEKLEMNPNYFPEKAIKAEIEALGGIWIDLPERDQYQTYDGNHLTEKSARQLSKNLGRYLRQRLQARGRVLWRRSLDFESITLPNLIQDSTAPKGATVQEIAAQQFSYALQYQALPLDSVLLTVSAWVKLPDAEKGAMLVLSVDDASGTLLWEGSSLIEQVMAPAAWTKVKLSVPYRHKKQSAILKGYVWNNSNKRVLVDQLTLKMEVL